MPLKPSRRAQRAVLVSIILLLCTWGVLIFLVRPLDRQISTSYRITEFSADYMEENKGKIIVQIPEAFELFYVMASVSEVGQRDPWMIDRDTPYYSAVQETFRPFAGHPAIGQIDRALQRWSISTLGLSFAYELEGNRLIKGQPHNVDHLFTQVLSDKTLIEEFVQQSGFRSYYSSHIPFYDQQILLYQQNIPIDKMWSWLESQFSSRHEVYRVVLSPLLNGTQYTYQFTDAQKEFSEIVMCVPLLNRFYQAKLADGTWNEEQTEALSSLILFTEIDHNYVNPATDRFWNRLQIARTFADTKEWYTGNGYNTASRVFNEYLTWALFSLYSHDTYGEQVTQLVIEGLNRTMQMRGFSKFDQFNSGLMEIYNNRQPGQTVEDLYGEIIAMARRL